MLQRQILAGIPMLAFGAVIAALALAQPVREPIRQGPESVFEEPVDRLFDALAGATATGDNARVGGELVYWSYALADGRDVFLFACAKLEGVDCEARRAAICPGGGSVVARSDVVGRVRQLDCRSVAVAAPGELRPGCTDQEVENVLDVGIVQCN